MNIRKMIATFMLGLTMAIGSQICTNHAAFAEDVWAYSDEWGDYYVMTETIRTEKHDDGKVVWVKTKKVKDEKVIISTVGFSFYGNLKTIILETLDGFRNFGDIERTAHGRALWNVVKQYL